ncbi:TetR/AcrR family transcriptional regulator [Breznakiella homolactica]|uniref:TetR/AcrR family transcriptional regulator n=1 Tax=Breznakiella homolactica TaxID=2798577 RepID=A0A7T7XRE8_9SPIR|nr:TetR/AcrR family transcriptional regulator [Breznakiella homolactica]QQO11129.1 TetR/AcrR family transcriptional regulator [Breznakiella homolactica]
MKNDNSRNTILQCALTLFSEKGFDGVSINDIVEMADITKPTLYYFFGSKEGLFKEILFIHYDVLNGLLQNVCYYEPHLSDYHADVEPVLRRIVRTYFDFAQKHAQFYLMALSLTFAPPTSRPAELAENYHRVQYELVEAMFLQISRSHFNLRGREQLCTWQFLAGINAHIGFWNRGFGSLDDSNVNALVKQFMHGIFS